MRILGNGHVDLLVTLPAKFFVLSPRQWERSIFFSRLSTTLGRRPRVRVHKGRLEVWIAWRGQTSHPSDTPTTGTGLPQTWFTVSINGVRETYHETFRQELPSTRVELPLFNPPSPRTRSHSVPGSSVSPKFRMEKSSDGPTGTRTTNWRNSK